MTSRVSFQDTMDRVIVGGEAPPVRRTRGKPFLKRCIDLALASFMLILLAPLFAAIAVLILITSRGPVVYSQDRVGQGGRVFRFYKFRSMYTDGDAILRSYLAANPRECEVWTKFQKLEQDPRVTRLGRIIRRTSLDELPQLINVLKGDMSLVGPRPCMPHQKELYGDAWQYYCAVAPGLTGLWQVSGRNKLSYEERVQLDLKYVLNWSLSLDVKILGKTALVVLSGEGSA